MASSSRNRRDVLLIIWITVIMGAAVIAYVGNTMSLEHYCQRSAPADATSGYRGPEFRGPTTIGCWYEGYGLVERREYGPLRRAVAVSSAAAVAGAIATVIASRVLGRRTTTTTAAGKTHSG